MLPRRPENIPFRYRARRGHRNRRSTATATITLTSDVRTRTGLLISCWRPITRPSDRGLFQSLGSLVRCDTPITESLRRGVKARIHATHGRRGFFDLRTKAAGAFASERCPIRKLI